MDDLKVQSRSDTIATDPLAGYRETELGVLPEEWKIVRLGNLATAKYGKAKPKDRGDVPTIGSGGIYG